MDMVPKTVVRRHNCLPLFIEDNSIVVACADEPDTELEDEIRLRFGKPIRAVIASGKSINQAIATNYAPGMRKEAAEPVKGSSKTKSSSSQKAVAAAAPMTEEEREQRQKLGWILMCWSVIVPAWLDISFLWQRFYRFFLPGFMEYVPFTALLIGVPLAFLFYNTHVKKK
jgi:hypothetical protein